MVWCTTWEHAVGIGMASNSVLFPLGNTTNPHVMCSFPRKIIDFPKKCSFCLALKKTTCRSCTLFKGTHTHLLSWFVVWLTVLSARDRKRSKCKLKQSIKCYQLINIKHNGGSKANDLSKDNRENMDKTFARLK